MKYRFPLLLMCLALPTNALAGQNFSRSLTECSAIYTALLVRPAAIAGNTADDSARIKDTAVAYLDRAMKEARREGHAQPVLRVSSQHYQLMVKWTPKVYAAASVAETRDWLDYCDRFGSNLGLPSLRKPDDQRVGWLVDQ